MIPKAPVASDVERAIRTLCSLSRAAWQNWPNLEITQVAICLAVIEGEISEEAQAKNGWGEGHHCADMSRVGDILGGLVMSSIRWMDDLGLNPHEYIWKAIAAQRKYVSDV
jgi:hypothetical protein